jgi:S1-C subfamily serine protease
VSLCCWGSASDNLHVLVQTPVGDANELDSAELQSVKLFQESTPSVVNISNISELPLFVHVSVAAASGHGRSEPRTGTRCSAFPAGVVRSQRGAFMSMDSQKLPVGQGSGFIWDKSGHIVTNWCA